jgi:hypothetical protein
VFEYIVDEIWNIETNPQRSYGFSPYIQYMIEVVAHEKFYKDVAHEPLHLALRLSEDVQRYLHHVSHPNFEKMKPKPLYVCPRCSNHMYSNNMISRYNISLIHKLKSYKMTRGSKRRLQSSSRGNLSADGAFTSATGGEVGLASFFFILLIPLISTPIFDSL